MSRAEEQFFSSGGGNGQLYKKIAG